MAKTKPFTLQAYGLAAVMLGSMAFVPIYGVAAAVKGLPKAPLVYVALAGFFA
eukprot:CAMPEP_0172077494 /NCGR_PEP_ID=MMETSP1043-20130122/17090_1 /TAXON_ID=464988 /ORGANISM="Hemiselmis andersenii, Strain CCMP441" /LENGTH=52 /DNA_ID=CAMNT_0012738455 /DNA_START=114 /DNA_END=268 /DNA_ORIENTATION=-